MLDVLEFRINSPTPYTFLRFFRHINPMQPAASALASYLIVSPQINLESLWSWSSSMLTRRISEGC